MPVYYLAAALAGLGLFGMIPGIVNVTEHFTHWNESLGISRWVFLLLLVGTVQVAYAVYLAQLPDWSTLWVVAMMSLVTATMYAMFLGLSFRAASESALLQALHLDRVGDGKASLWCLAMLSLTSLVAYFAGRMSVRWHRRYRSE